MTLSQVEFEAILNDESKTILGDIPWREDEDHSPAWEFRVEVRSTAGWPLIVKGRYNPRIPTASFALILTTVGRIYALDLGKEHHNPQCEDVGNKHKHRWSEPFRDKQAYVPSDITAPVDDPVAVWQQFCVEARIHHQGKLASLPPLQGRLFP